MKKLIVTALFCLTVAVSGASLDLGDNAPAISPDVWITGQPADPTEVDGKTFYIVEVWSVTCPPCVRTIPILNDIQKRYADKGLRIVSFTTDAREDVERFLALHPIEYNSFIDKEGATMVNYMAADNRNTIPHAFLFDKTGALVWIGNPLDNLEGRVQQVLSGDLNRDKALAVRDAKEALQTSFAEQNIEGMLASLTELERLEPDSPQYYQVHYRLLTDLGAGDVDDVQELMNNWYQGCQGSAEGLVVLSMLAMDQGPPNMRNPHLALAAAKRAYELDSDAKVQAGMNLAETYKEIGRLDLSLRTLGEISRMTEDPEEKELIQGIRSFYNKIQQLGKNPDAPYQP